MRIGKFEIEQLSEGVFRSFKDSSFTKTDAGTITANESDSFSDSYSQPIGIDPVLIRDGKYNILLDTGLGWGLDSKSAYKNTSNLRTNLDIFGLTPDDITHVVLTHLHFDHAAGCTYVNDLTQTQATMPYAHYFVQKLEWKFAVEQMINQGGLASGSEYKLDEFYKLLAEDKLVMINEPFFELLPGIDIIHTGGHTPGHQIVKIHDAGETAYFLGDLVPSEQYLNSHDISQKGCDPVQSKKARILILRQALIEKAALLFYHSIHIKAGRLVEDENRTYIIEKI